MQTIATKLTAVRSIPAAQGWSDNELRSLIHGTGGSPRRAKRLLRADPALAKLLAEQYAAAIESGTHHIHAVKACAEQFAEMFGRPAPSDDDTDGDDTEAGEAGEGDADEQPAAEPVAAAPAKTVKRVRKAKADAAALKALADEPQAALL